ncbi:hypothetical protein SY85_10645 [Flavisolibacter tropicus]|uniref:histidine kinase n=1 Tax=Flavisolibacter tropicus TaxID=1492898 RepID=A0A172TVS8_9BACT|nr:hypothetical protein SY85_10645 [Flavisolibacter tropicus]
MASFTFHYFIVHVLVKQIDDDLEIEQREIQTYVKKYNRLPEPIPVRDQVITHTPIPAPIKEQTFTSTTLFDSLSNGNGIFRQMVFSINVNGQWYKILVAKSEEDTDDLIEEILLIVLTTVIFMLLASFIINRIVLKRLWNPFYNMLESFNQFRLGKKQELNFKPTDIDEFELLRKTMQQTINKAESEYHILKEFTENASHEMQTPLAIIRSKLDLLIQDEALSETQSKMVQSAYSAIEKLNRLNQSLLLLTKIENSQFEKVSVINLKQKVEEKLAEFLELWDNQQVLVTAELKEITILMNNELADVLLNNLLSNATRHNYTGGRIAIFLDADHLRIVNSGNRHSLDEEKIFQRFYKSVQSSESNGLGLSIIKQICDVSGFTAIYGYEPGIHTFIIRW